MTATATPTRTLADVLRERWASYGPKANYHSTSGDPLDDACQQLVEALIGDYRIITESAIAGGEVDIGAEWFEPMEAAAFEAGRAAWRQHVEPAVIAALAERIPQAPEWLRMHPESDQLRADLELTDR